MTSFQYTEIKYMLTVRETANILDVSVHIVYRLIESGELSAVKLSQRKTVIKAKEIERYINKKQEDFTMKEFTQKEILTREEVMEVLKIGRSTFYKLLQTGELKGFKEGNRYKVPAHSIEEYVDKRMEQK